LKLDDYFSADTRLCAYLGRKLLVLSKDAFW
jgi:hypothetical protein